MTRNWLLWGILGYLAWANRGILTLGRRETILWWIDPETEQILYLPGVDPPASGWRPASEVELQAWAALPMQGEMNDTLPYDFSRPHVREAGWNQGCPLGYFAQFVAAGSVDAADTGTGSGAAVRCRLLPDPVTATPDEVQAVLDESGVSWGETFDTYQQAIADSLPSMGNLRWGGIVLAAIAGFIAWKSLR